MRISDWSSDVCSSDLEGSMDERLPQYLHKPVQILWFGSDEFVLVVTTIFVAVIVCGLVGWAFFAALLLFLPFMLALPRGFLPLLPFPLCYFFLSSFLFFFFLFFFFSFFSFFFY